MKQKRWYEIVNDLVYIYDNGYSNKSQSVSVVHKSELSYYRSAFILEKSWGVYEQSL